MAPSPMASVGAFIPQFVVNEKNFAPALRRLPHPILDGHEPLRQQLQGRSACYSRPEGHFRRRQPRYKLMAPHPS